MRIALAGAGGTGKGTLGSALSAYYKVPFITSHIKDTGEAMGMSNYLDVTDERALAFQYSIMFGQIYQERSLHEAGMNYIAERSVFDYVPYFLEKNLSDDTYLDIIRKWGADNYDAIIFLPLEFVPKDKDTNCWKERDAEHQKRTTRIIKEEIEKYYKKPILTVSGGLWERVDQCKDFFSKNNYTF